MPDSVKSYLLSPLNWLQIAKFALSDQMGDKANAHIRAYDKDASALRKMYKDTSSGSPYDRAKNYIGGYDWMLRNPTERQKVEDMARTYQGGDYLASLWKEGDGSDLRKDAEYDYLENLAGIAEAARQLEAGPPMPNTMMRSRAAEWAERNPRDYAHGGLVSPLQQYCNCKGK